MIVGIIGKKQSGKNTVASMLQYLFTSEKEQNESSFKDYMSRRNNSEYFERISGWKQKAFAYKVKQVLSILTGMPVEDMERGEIKSSFLPDEWNRQFLEVKNERIGPFYSEKETVDYVNKHRIKYFTQGKFPITVRQALQYIGTDIFRDHFDEDVWIKALFSEYSKSNDWLITDVRFPNEVEAIQIRGGYLIKLSRNNDSEDTHESEQYIEEMDADFVVDNTSSLENLFNTVKTQIFPIIKK
jgi:hypothetical protein